MNDQRFVATDQVWRQLEPHLSGKSSDAGVTVQDNRRFLEAVFWRARKGLPWRDLPPSFGNWNSQFRRFRRWAKAGVFEGLFNAMSGDPDVNTRLWLLYSRCKTYRDMNHGNTPEWKAFDNHIHYEDEIGPRALAWFRTNSSPNSVGCNPGCRSWI